MKAPFVPRIKKSTLIFTAVLGLSAACVSAQTSTTYTGAIDDKWETAGNWDNGLPSSTNQARFLNGALPDAPIVVTVGASAPAAKDLNFATSGDRSVTINGTGPGGIGGSILYLSGTNGATWNTSFSSTNPVTINANVDYSNTLADTAFTFAIGVAAPITFNGNITTSGTGSRQMTISSSSIVTINGSNAATHLSFGGTGELIAGSTSALGSGAVQKTTDSILSLRSDVTVTGGGNTYSWLQNTTTRIRINETTPGSTTDRTLTMEKRIAGTGTLTFIENVNSTGKLILELQYSGGTAQGLGLALNDTAIIRFTQTGDTIYSGIISGTGEVQKKVGAGTTTLSAANTYTGDTIIDTGTIVLSDTGKLNFLIGDDGVNNQITGAGNLTLNGAFTFDLSGAGSNLGDSWNIVDLASLNTVTFGVTFAVDGFTKTGNLWTLNDYQFDQTSGYLSVVPEPSALLLAAWGLALLASRRRRQG